MKHGLLKTIMKLMLLGDLYFVDELCIFSLPQSVDMNEISFKLQFTGDLKTSA